MPSTVGFFSVRQSPSLGPSHTKIGQEFVLCGLIAVEDRRELDISNRTYSKPFRTFAVEQPGRCHTERWVSLSHVNQQASIHHPSHQGISPARSSSIQSAVGRTTGRKRRAKPSMAIAPAGCWRGVTAGSCRCNQTNNFRARASSSCFTFSITISIALMQTLYHLLGMWQTPLYLEVCQRHPVK